MESMRDINRVMEREIAKGSSPLKLDHIEFGGLFVSGDNLREKIGRCVILFVKNKGFQTICRKNYFE